jgi:chromate transporter
MRRLWELFWIFFKIGAFTLGSGYAIVPVIEHEIVDRRKWFDLEDFRDQFTLAQSVPGPFSLNTAVFVGYRMKGFWGAFFAVAGLVVPTFGIMLVVAIFLAGIRDNEIVAAAFKGLRPCVDGLIAVPCVRMLIKMNVWQMLLGAAALALICFTGISPIYMLIFGAALGIVLCCVGNKEELTK